MRTSQMPSHNTEEATTIQVHQSEDTTITEDVSSHETGLYPPVNRGLKRCASFPTMRAEMVEIQNAGELREAIETMDAELDRTVETIDGLTKDLMAVATHQSWMQTRLEENLQLQGMQNESMEDLSDDQSLEENGRPSMSSDRTVPCQEEDDWMESAPWNKSDPTDCSPSAANGDSNKRLSSRDFSQYFEALGKIAAMGQELEDRDRTLHRGLMFSDLDTMNHRKGNFSQRSSGSSYTLNNDFSLPVSPSECSLESLFDAKLDSGRRTSMALKKVGVETLSTSIQDVEIKESFRPVTWFTSLGWPRWQKLAMPANWPTPRDTTSPESAELEDDGLSSEGATALTNLLNMYVYLGLLLFWTLAFAAAVLFVVPSLAEVSGQRARGLMAQIQKLLASPSEDQENSQGNAWGKPLVSAPNSHRRYHSASQGLRHGSRNRRKLNHQRIRRNLMTGSKADYVDSSKTALLRGKLATLNEESWSSKVSVCSLSSETTAAANTSAIFEDWE
ncbi:hypothetical protein BGX34_006290 [Mortierella sp. NVP85]|nr:hypothetical protein BGX34_006290 [Mortierella sp. NVP85]